MLRYQARAYISSIRLLSQTSFVKFRANAQVLGKFKLEQDGHGHGHGLQNGSRNGVQDDIESPTSMAKDSSLPLVEQKYKVKPRQPKKKAPFLSEMEDDPNSKLSSWQEKIGQWVISTFSVDMDKSRSGPVAGGIYFAECKRQALVYPNEPMSDTAKFYYQTLALPISFSQQVQIIILHYWILSVRMRALPSKYAKEYQKKLVDRIFSDLETRMNTELGIKSGRIIEGYLKDFHTQFLGSVLSYDEGLMTDDITLAAALWRNVFNAKEDADIRHVEALLVYVRSQLYVLSKMTDRAFGFGKFKFVPPDQIVTPITKHQEAMIKQKTKEEFSEMNLPSQRSVLSMDE
ncbi:CBP3 [Candida oxycetoniae]|uniref:CBP3 n=1 Tax=Candida oxycetoniae TaxID=497107 RepID=A0AAI9SSU7_9ASCO|nr:CBP3 [Candida oxycetoniae]KAI3402493.1 CBP3 [Candida oxycetoniae]